MPETTMADGSAASDRHETVRIDPSETTDRWRYTCPNGHPAGSWDATNCHLYCTSCARARDTDPTITPDHYHVVDQRSGDEIPWSAVFLVGFHKE